MFDTNETPTPLTVAKSAIRNRDIVREELEKSRRSGVKREIRKWEKLLRQHEKMVADYGLDEFVRRANSTKNP
ncbi:MAG: hypothetical protein AAF468_20125 [Pseudomonadota bacterium]